MCRTASRDQRIEGWRATLELLSALRPSRAGVLAAFAARLARRLFATPARRV